MRVVLIHGYLAPKAIFRPLVTRLRRAGHEPQVFGYPSRRGTLQDHADALYARLARLGPCALVGHSMGGLLIHRVLHDQPDLPVTHRVFIATPHRGSQLAVRSTRSPLWRLMGTVVRSTVRGVPVPDHPSAIGVILGAKDRTVRPTEGDLTEADARLILPRTHNQLILDPRVAGAINRFLTHGLFEAPDDLARALVGGR